ncbi:Lar family restriction alleviation protein [Sphingobium sp. EP60837]|uniref:Lar family restriction alleviation protein n=1 Tax=Sphingobium sp. EP60837 TaxID=1855519 RepID=UPI0007DD5DB1|nr:Lar family restriction alleviation protein [Sphingobium sp. EP60837]ANI76465.1 hypothetical protein EP837_00006 [Sphingobium sp. EP60837]
MSGLLPCPFCGGEASDGGWTRYSKPLHDANWADGSPITEAFYVNCISCSASNRSTLSGGFQTKERAVTHWNTRAAIGMEAGTGETEGLDPKGDSPDPKGIAMNAGHSTPGDAEVRKALEMAQEIRDLLLERIQGSPARSAAHNARVRTESLIAHLSSIAPTQMEICPDCSGAGGDNNVWVCSRCNGSGGLATPSGRAQGEVVAWLYETEQGDKELLLDGRIETARRLLEAGYTETPLYAAPPAQDQGEGEPKSSFPPVPSGKPPHGVYG